MSDGSSIPSINQQNEGNETEPHGGESSASSLGAPATPDVPSTELEEDEEPDAEPDADPNEHDSHGEPDQVT